MLTPPTPTAFGAGDLVEVDTDTVRAVARVRESSQGGRLHIAFEMGEYLPWVDADVLIRHFGNDPSRSWTAKILHAGTSTALLQIVDRTAESAGPLAPREPLDTIPAYDDES